MNKRNSGGKRSQEPPQPVTGIKWTDLEQNRLQKLLDKGTVSVNDSAAKVKDQDEFFDKFSNNVVGYHLGILRKKSKKKSTILCRVLHVFMYIVSFQVNHVRLVLDQLVMY